MKTKNTFSESAGTIAGISIGCLINILSWIASIHPAIVLATMVSPLVLIFIIIAFFLFSNKILSLIEMTLSKIFIRCNSNPNKGLWIGFSISLTSFLICVLLSIVAISNFNGFKSPFKVIFGITFGAYVIHKIGMLLSSFRVLKTLQKISDCEDPFDLPPCAE